MIHQKIEGRLAPIARAITWCLPIAIIGYFYAGLQALIFLPFLIILFSMSVPVLYPALNFNIQFVDDADEQISSHNKSFWTIYMTDVSNLKQLANFIMSAAIVLSCYLGITRHNYLVKTAELEFQHSGKTNQFSLIGPNAQGYVVINTQSNTYLLVSYNSIDVLTSSK